MPESGSETPRLRPAEPSCRGRIETWKFRSALLARTNPLRDPVERALSAYLPAVYDQDRERHFPTLWSLAAYTSSGPAQLSWRNHGESLPDRLDRLMADGTMDPAIVVFADSYTSLGGNQFVDSPALGPYASHLIEELVPEIDARFRTIAEPSGRALFGKSSGGFGGLHIAARHPGHFGGVASHAGDSGFDRVFVRDFPPCCDELARHGGDLVAFVREFWRARRPSGRAFHTLMVLCLAASYSPREGQPLNLELPFDLHTAKLDEQTWRRWLEFDPVRYGEPELDALRGLAGLWIDAGNRDQYFIHYGTRELHDRLDQAGVGHHYEEFDGNHSGMDWRLDFSLPWLVRQLKQD